jgi:hypothetical protein
MLDKIYLNTEVSGYQRTGKLSVQQIRYLPLRKPELQTVDELRKLGLIDPYGSYPHLTDQGWQAVGRTPMQEHLSNLHREIGFLIEHARDSHRNDRASWSDHNVAFYRELYQNPDMTTGQVKVLEESRVRDNRIIAESDIQGVEHALAYWEFKANRS